MNRCSSNDLTNAGRKLFEKIGISKRQLSVLTGILHSQEVVNLSIEEKEPTAYLYRRALASHLYALDFTESEMQYYIGHDVEAIEQKRNDFVNKEMLYGIKLKLDMHPAYAYLGIKKKPTVLNSQEPGQTRYYAEEEFRIDLDSKHPIVAVSVVGKEPNDAVRIRMSETQGAKLTVMIDGHPEPVEYGTSTDISYKVWNIYAQEREK